MRSKLAAKILVSALLVSASTYSIGQQAFVSGPIEKISFKSGSITVLGQAVQVDKATIVSLDGKTAQSSKAIAFLSVGGYAFVEFVPNSVSFAKIVIAPQKFIYVPGATPVGVAGKITSIEKNYGKMRVGQLIIDISALPPEIVSQFAVGTFVTLEGIQPTFGGPLAGLTGLSIGGSGVQSIGGSGVQSIGGSGVQSIGGSGVQSIGGSGALSIGGSGLQSIGGSGALSIGGSGVQSIGGSGALSIGGSGVQSIGGSGALSIGGSGALSIGGSGALSIGGSGARSIGGSGR
jgi:hypothetical protein